MQKIPSSKTQLTSTIAGKDIYQGILDRDHYMCRGCGTIYESGVSLNVDHIKPRCAGGTHDPRNLQVLCNSCNSSKSGWLDRNWDKINAALLCDVVKEYGYNEINRILCELSVAHIVPEKSVDRWWLAHLCGLVERGKQYAS